MVSVYASETGRRGYSRWWIVVHDAQPDSLVGEPKGSLGVVGLHTVHYRNHTCDPVRHIALPLNVVKGGKRGNILYVECVLCCL